MFIWSIDVCIDICRYVYSIYIYTVYRQLYTHTCYYGFKGWRTLELTLLFCWFVLLSDQHDQRSVSAILSDPVQKPDNVIDTSKFDRFRNPKNPNYFCFKIKTWTSKVSQIWWHQIAVGKPWGFPMFSKSQPLKDKCGTCGGSWCQCLWFFSRPGLVEDFGAKIEMSNLEALWTQIPSNIIFWGVVQMSTVIYVFILLLFISLLADSRSWEITTHHVCILSYLRLRPKVCIRYVILLYGTGSK